MKMLIWGLFGFVFTLILIISWASFPWSLNESTSRLAILNVEPDEMMDVPEHPSVIKILTFNISFIYGKGSEGPGYEHRERDYFEKRLDIISQEIKDWDADVVCLQEVDFDSSRSHSIDQASYIAKKASYPYVAQAPSWTSNYIPFPYWPLKNNFGKVHSGGAILSRYPLTDLEVILLPKPQSQPWWYNLFYLHRYFQKVSLSAGDKNLKLINLHLEAFDKVDRKSQVTKLVGIIKTEKIDIVAGDFNMLPSSANKRSKFFNDDDYENDSSYEIMQNLGHLEVIPDDIYAKSEADYFTFPAWAPDRRLDYIWFEPELKMMKAEVLSSAMSDHLPLRATFQIDSPKINPYSL